MFYYAKPLQWLEPSRPCSDQVLTSVPSDPFTSGQLEVQVYVEDVFEIRSLRPHLEVVYATYGHILSAV